jgi:hypothetical protein
VWLAALQDAHHHLQPRIIAEYGQEYEKDNPIHILYDGYGHYNALQYLL